MVHSPRPLCSQRLAGLPDLLLPWPLPLSTGHPQGCVRNVTGIALKLKAFMKVSNSSVPIITQLFTWKIAQQVMSNWTTFSHPYSNAPTAMYLV